MSYSCGMIWLGEICLGDIYSQDGLYRFRSNFSFDFGGSVDILERNQFHYADDVFEAVGLLLPEPCRKQIRRR